MSGRLCLPVDRPCRTSAGARECSLPAGVYIHIPFCRRRCHYCHFAISLNQPEQHARLVQALKAEWTLRLPHLDSRPLASIYFGGGTPSLLAPDCIAELLDHLPPAHEITLEVNPEDVTLSRMCDYRAAGINRVSLGVQTLDDGLLRAIGRHHTAAQALAAIEITASAGISNLSADLILELPHQTLHQVVSSLDLLVATRITHLSLYNLTIESPAPYYWRRSEILDQMPPDESALQMMTTAVDHLTKHGFERYEISAFSRGAHRAIHNTGYWEGRPFLGLGPAAFSFLDLQRTRNASSLPRYLELVMKGQEATDLVDTIPDSQRRRELLAVGLRLLDGVDLKVFEARHGVLDSETQTALTELLSQGLITCRDSILQLTDQGILFHDTVASALI